MNKIKLDNIKNDYFNLGYRIFIAVMVSLIPYMILGSMSGVVSIDNCYEWETQEKIDSCIEAVNSTKQFVPIASIVFGLLLGGTALSGMIWEWKRGEKQKRDRTPLKLNHMSNDERIVNSKYEKEKYENEEILKKYKEMDDLK